MLLAVDPPIDSDIAAACQYRLMGAIEIRAANPDDADAVADCHDRRFRKVLRRASRRRILVGHGTSFATRCLPNAEMLSNKLFRQAQGFGKCADP